MIQFPPSMDRLIEQFATHFTKPTFKRVKVLLAGALLSPGRRTVTNMLWTVRSVMDGHPSSYHRVLSHRRWSLWPLGRVLAAMVLEHVPADQPVKVAVDDHAVLHKGAKVFGKDKHRDAVRSSHGNTVWLFGHEWVVLTICVKFAFASRPWALPVLCALYHTPKQDAEAGLGHKKPLHWARGLIAVLCRWFPERTFTIVGDAGFSSHEAVRFGRRHRRRLTMIGKMNPDANLHQPPPPRKPGQKGRPRVKGQKMPSPRQAFEQSETRQTLKVDWYGKTRRNVQLLSESGHWHKDVHGLVPLRWVYVRDLDGNHRDECFYSTDLEMSPAQIVEEFTNRWPIEVTFQESIAHLGLHTPRNRTRLSVLRTTPCLLGLYSLVSLIFAELHRQHGYKPRRVPGYTKAEPTFADALAAVRHCLWQALLQTPENPRPTEKPPPKIITMLLESLSHAA